MAGPRVKPEDRLRPAIHDSYEVFPVKWKFAHRVVVLPVVIRCK